MTDHGPGSRVTEWLTAREAAGHMRLPSVKALYQRVARGQMKAYRFGRQLRFRRQDLDAMMRGSAEHRVTVRPSLYDHQRCAPSPEGDR